MSWKKKMLNFKEIGEGKLTQHGKDIFVSGTVIRTEL